MEEARSATIAWGILLKDVLIAGEHCRPRGLQCRELMSYRSCTDMARPVMSLKYRRLGYRFMAAEAWWILSGKNDVRSIEKYSPQIKNFSDDGITFSGAYGPKIVDQVRYMAECLAKDPDTRQCVASIWRPNPRDSKDIPCTVSVQLLLRNGLLHCVDTMRSSDSWLGWPYDVFNFTMLTAYVALHARILNPSLKILGLGNLYLTAGSQHLYQKDFDGAARCLDELGKNSSECCHEYSPFLLHEFRSPLELLDHLEMLKDHDGEDSSQKLEPRFLLDLFRQRYGK